MTFSATTKDLKDALTKTQAALEGSLDGIEAALKTLRATREPVLWFLGTSLSARIARVFLPRARALVPHRATFEKLYTAARVVELDLEHGALQPSDIERLARAVGATAALFEDQ